MKVERKKRSMMKQCKGDEVTDRNECNPRAPIDRKTPRPLSVL